MLRCEILEDMDSRFGWRAAGHSAALASWKFGPACRILIGLLFWTSPWLRAGTIDTQPPSVPDALAASAVTSTTFTLGWRAATDNVKVTGYEVFLDGKAGGTTTALSKTFTCLDPASCYRLSVRARDGKGNWSACSPELVVTTAPDRSPPSVPNELKAENVKLKSFTLSWVPSTDDVKVTGYEVFKDGSSLGTTSGHSRNISGLAVGSVNVMTVRARDEAGNWSAMSLPLKVKTLTDTTAPTVPEGICARSVIATRLVLKWVPAKDDVKVVAYELSNDGKSLGIAPGAARKVTNLQPLTTYVFRVRAVDEAGNWSSWSVPVQVKTSADSIKPSTPSALVASAVTESGFALTWSASSDNVGVTAYEVQRDSVGVGTSLTPALVVSGLHAGTIYSMRVRALDAAGNGSAWSPPLKVKTASAEAAPPASPVGLTASAVTSTGFVLGWALAPYGATSVGFDVLLDGVSVGTTSNLTMAFSDLLPGATYRAAVRAKDAAGRWSDLSSELLVVLAGGSFLGGFEAAEGYQLGSLASQNSWSVTGSADVVASPVFAGRQALSVPANSSASFATHAFPASGTDVTFIDFFALPVAAESPEAGVFFETATAELALTKENGVGVLQAFDGDGRGGGTWHGTDAAAPLLNGDVAADWIRLTLRTDPIAKRWDLYFNGRLVAVDLGFATDEFVAPGVLTLGGNRSGPTGFDELFVSGENPVANDADHDGMDDAWEVAHGLSPAVDDRRGDLDGDGIDNLHENLLGTEPNQLDTDGDGLPDGWELVHGLDPRSPSDALRDDDGDGLTNGAEYLSGSNPIDFFNGRGFTLESAGRSPGTTYAYDLSGRLASATYSSGRATRFAFDGAGNLLSVTSSGRAPLTDWFAAHGLPTNGIGQGSELAIVAGDGLPNLAKYAFGLDPHAAVVGDFPAITRSVAGGHSYLTLAYQRPDPAPPDLRYTVEVSDDGSTWRSGATVTAEPSVKVSNGLAVVVTRDASPADGHPLTRRMRLKIERKISP